MANDEQAAGGTDQVAADTAALAANQAERAAAAAESAVVNAEIAAAGVATVAAEQTAASEQRIAEWQIQQETRHSQISQEVEQHRLQNEQLTQGLAALQTSLSQIQERLANMPASPASREQNRGGDEPPAQAEPPKEEKPPERRRAHRWT